MCEDWVGERPDRSWDWYDTPADLAAEDRDHATHPDAYPHETSDEDDDDLEWAPLH
jgi:hypothetical protein